MVGIDETLTPDQANHLLQEWQRMARNLGQMKSQEFLLRSRLFKHFFPDPIEGTNTFQLGAGYELKATYPFARDVDEEAITKKDNELKALGINPATLVKQKPSLQVAIYRTLTDEQRNLFDTCLTIKPGAPGLQIKAPKGAPASDTSEQADDAST